MAAEPRLGLAGRLARPFLRSKLTPVIVLVQGAVAVLFFPPAFAAVSRIVPVHMRNLAVSLATAVGAILGGGGVPSLVGYLAELSSFATGFTVVGALAVLSSLLLHPRIFSASAESLRGRA